MFSFALDYLKHYTLCITQSILVLRVLVVTLSLSMMWTTAPQPEIPSRSKAFIMAWENIYHPLQKYLPSYLGDALKQLIRTHLWFPQGLGHSHQLFLASSSGNKVNGLRNTTCKFTDSMVKDFCFFIESPMCTWCSKKKDIK